MFSKIAIGQLCGFLFLFILLTTMLSKAMAGDPLDPEDVPNTLGAVAESGKKFRISIVFDLLSHVSIVALAAALYLAFSPHNRSPIRSRCRGGSTKAGQTGAMEWRSRSSGKMMARRSPR